MKRNLVIGFVILSTIVAAAVFLFPKRLTGDLKHKLAQKLGVKPEFLMVNIPPASGRTPGSTFAKKATVIPVLEVPRSDPDMHAGAEFNIDWSDASLGKAKGNVTAGILGSIFSDAESSNFEIKASHCRVLEMPFGELKKRLLSSQAILNSSAEGISLFVIVRAFEGQLSIRIKRAQDASGEAWARTQQNAVTLSDPKYGGDAALNVNSEGKDQFVVEWKEPVVFAYELQKAELFASHLGTRPDDIRFTPLTEDQWNEQSQTAASDSGRTAWSLLTIASGVYPQFHSLDQSWNVQSASVAESALKMFNPRSTKRIWANAKEPLSADRLTDTIQEYFRDCCKRGDKLFIVYYVGHMELTSSKDLRLLMGDLAPASEVNNQDLSSNGYLPLETFCQSLTSSKCCTVFLIDGCSRDEDEQDLGGELAIANDFMRGKKQFPSSPSSSFWFRKKKRAIASITKVKQAMIDALIYDQDNGISERGLGYLKGDNPVLIGSPPAASALGENPFFIGGPLIGPLAGEIYKRALPASLFHKSLGSVLNSLPFYHDGALRLPPGVGYSWSDFKRMTELSTAILGDG